MEKGVPVVERQSDMTPFQRQVLISEFQRQEEMKQEQLSEQPNQRGRPRQISGGRRNQRNSSPGSKKEAIKRSQEDQEKFVNKSIVNNESS